jgi:hypothetical protein
MNSIIWSLQNLKFLNLGYNQIGFIDLNQHPTIETVSMYNNSLDHFRLDQCPNLKSIDLYQNLLTYCDFSYNPMLDSVDFSHNNLSSISVSSLPLLKTVHGVYNQLDDFRCYNAPNLEVLNLNSNQFSVFSTNFENYSNLKTLYINNNPNLSTLYISDLLSLQNLYCQNGQLTTLDASNLTALTYLDCSYNQLTSLNLHNTTITYIDYSHNLLGTSGIIWRSGASNNAPNPLNISDVSTIAHLDCSFNQLVTFDLRGFTNLNYFDSRNNPNLTTILVDNIANANANTSWYKDATVNYISSNNTAPPVAAFDSKVLCYSSVGIYSNNFQLTANDYDSNFNPVDASTIDLDPSTPQQDTSIVVNGLQFSFDSNGYLSSQTSSLGVYTFSYTVKDFSGQVSNIADVIVYITTTVQTVSDIFSPINGATGGTTASVLDNDYVDGESYISVNLVTYESSSGPFTISPSGHITIPPGTASGVYYFPYLASNTSHPTAECSVSQGMAIITVESFNYYEDVDGDGFGNPSGTIVNTPTASYVLDNTDCNDNQIQYADADNDGFGSTIQVACGVVNNTDCNDANPMVHATVTPTFTQITPICTLTTISPLPTTSNNGITGTWSPAFNNATSPFSIVNTTYTFTPNAGQCATTTTMTLSVYPLQDILFFPIDPICAGDTLIPPPNTSPNGIPGTWSPAFNNMVTTTYTFTPDSGYCAVPRTLTITVNPPTTTNITTIKACSSYTWPVNGVTYTTSGTYSSIVGCTVGLLYLTIEVPTTWYVDADGDGAGNPAVSITSCTQPAGYVSNNFDFVDTNAAINPCAIENRADGIDNNCNGAIDEIVTKLVNSQCGANLTSINQLIVAQTVASKYTICGYRFKVTKMTGGVLSTIPTDIQIITPPSNSFNLTMLANYAYNTTYNVQVSVCTNGVWQTYGGNCCTVRCDKLSKIQSRQCGATLATMSTLIYADNVNNIKPASYVPAFVKPWRFEITQVTPGVGFGSVQTFDNQLRTFTMNNFASVTYNTTYSVRVAFMNVDGTWNYGPACTITTPFPTTQIQSSQCGFTALNGTQLIWATGVPSSVATPTHYRFRLSNASITYSATVDTTTKNFYLNQFAGLLTNTSYNVEVSLEIGGAYGPYGSLCTVTTPAVFRVNPNVETIAFNAVVYPNPTSDNFQIEVKTDDKSPIYIQIFDLLGRLVEDKHTNNEELQTIQLGASYPSGVYQVLVSQNENIKALKVVKR